MPGSVLAATGAPYMEALNTRRYDLGGNLQLIAHRRFVIAARMAGSLQQHDHLFGDVRERDRQKSLFAEVTVRGLEEERFLILPHPEVQKYMERRAQDHERWLGALKGLQRKLSKVD